MFINISKGFVIGILSLIVYIVVNDSEKDETKTREEKNKEYLKIVAIISVSSFMVIQMSQNNTSLVSFDKNIKVNEPMLNNKPPF